MKSDPELMSRASPQSPKEELQQEAPALRLRQKASCRSPLTGTRRPHCQTPGEGRPPFLVQLHNRAVSHTSLSLCLGPAIDPLEATTSLLHPIGHGQKQTNTV